MVRFDLACNMCVDVCVCALSFPITCRRLGRSPIRGQLCLCPIGPAAAHAVAGRDAHHACGSSFALVSQEGAGLRQWGGQLCSAAGQCLGYVGCAQAKNPCHGPGKSCNHVTPVWIVNCQLFELRQPHGQDISKLLFTTVSFGHNDKLFEDAPTRA